jgi:hypothetical protein
LKVKMERDVIWSPLGEPGLEHLKLLETEDSIYADGLIIAIDKHTPLRVHYQLRCDAGWRVRSLRVASAGDPPQLIELETDGAGHWADVVGNSLPSLDGCIDVDISVTPFTNTLPIQRLGLKPGETAEILVAYIAVEAMEMRPMRQRYTCIELGPDSARYKYESVESGFTAELTVDADGLVIEYSQLWRMVWPTEEKKLC